MATTKKKIIAKTTSQKKAVSKKPKAVTHTSFQRTNENAPFFTFKFTEQSLYWLILSMLVLALGTWVMYLNVKIQSIYDQVEINTQINEQYVIPAIEKDQQGSAVKAE